MKNDKIKDLLHSEGIEGVRHYYAEKFTTLIFWGFIIIIALIGGMGATIAEQSSQIERKDALIITQDSSLTYLQNNRISSNDTMAILFHGMTEGIVKRKAAK